MDAIRNLMFDVAACKTIYDAEQGREISKSEANDAIRRICFEKLGLNEKSSDRDIRRALNRDEAKEIFEIIEEIVDVEVTKGWENNEFFNNFVESKNLADGDDNEFWVEAEDIYLTVAKINGDQHHLTMQRLNKGQSFNVPTSVYGMKVGGDIRMFLTGRRDWNQLIDAITRAFVKKVQDELYAEFLDSSAKVPSTAQFNKTSSGSFSSSYKDAFDQLISDVSVVNGGADVVIMGTKTALKKLNALAGNGNGTISWVSDKEKDAIGATGILGDYEGTAMLEIPQRFADKKVADQFVELVKSDRVFIFPKTMDKPIKFVDKGETQLQRATELGDTLDDFQTYEVIRRMGIATIITRYFGTWVF